MTERKTRLLRKYEGDHNVVAVDPSEPGIEFFAPFGPLIAKTRIASAVVQRVNAFADRLVQPAKSLEFLVSNEAATAGSEDSLMRQIESAVRRLLRRR